MASLLPPTADESDIHAALLAVRMAPPAGDEEVLALVEAACAALTGVDQEVALSVAARPHNGDRDAWQALVADKRIASGEPAGDETLAPTMLVPLLRRATRLACTDPELGERLLDAVGTLTASLAGHGEHTHRIGLITGDITGRAPLLLRHVPSGPCTGFSPAARLGIGACAASWAGLRVEGRTVLELLCGMGAVGLACAALGAAEVWCTDSDAEGASGSAWNLGLAPELLFTHARPTSLSAQPWHWPSATPPPTAQPPCAWPGWTRWARPSPSRPHGRTACRAGLGSSSWRPHTATTRRRRRCWRRRRVTWTVPTRTRACSAASGA